MIKKRNHKFRLLWLKSKKQSSVLNKISIRDIVLPEVYSEDDSTISFVKRVGGQVSQHYRLHTYVADDIVDIPVDTPIDKVIEDFDFAVIKYKWLPTGGQDLDIRAHISSPDRSSTIVGWNRLNRDEDYLIWSGDNTADGVETLLFDVKKLASVYPTQEKIVVTLAAFWYNSIGSGNLELEFVSYKGGEMTPSGFDFVNDQGAEVQSVSLDSFTYNTDKAGDGDIVAYLEYDTIKKSGRLYRTIIGCSNPVSNFAISSWYLDPKFQGQASGLNYKVTVGSNPPINSDHSMDLSLTSPWSEGFISNFNDGIYKLELNYSTYYDATIYFLKVDGTIPVYPGLAPSKTVVFEPKTTQELDLIKDYKQYFLDSNTSANIIVLPNNAFSICMNEGYRAGDPYWRDNDMISVATDAIEVEALLKPINNELYYDLKLLGETLVTSDNLVGRLYTIKGYEISFKLLPDGYISVTITNKNLEPLEGIYDTVYLYMLPKRNVQTWANVKESFNVEEKYYSSLSPQVQVYADGVLVSPFYAPFSGFEEPGIPEPDINSLVFVTRVPTSTPTGLPLEITFEAPSSDWSIKESGVVIASSDGFRASHVINGIPGTYDPPNTVILKITSFSIENSYEVIGTFPEIEVDPSYVSGGVIELIQFPNPSYIIDFATYESTEFIVPSVLPPHVTTLERMFYYSGAFNQDISGWDTSNVTSMRRMFQAAYIFNQPIGSWNTSKVTDMNSMFEDTKAFNQPIGDWDVGLVTDMNEMFYEALEFNQPLNNWNVSSVTDMESMFQDTPKFNQLLNKWNISNVNEISSMFRGTVVFNQDLSKWKPTGIESRFEMARMFQDAKAFNQDLSSWCVTNVTSRPSYFDTGALVWTKPKPFWGTCLPSAPAIIDNRTIFNIGDSSITTSNKRTLNLGIDDYSGKWSLTLDGVVLLSNAKQSVGTTGLTLYIDSTYIEIGIPFSKIPKQYVLTTEVASTIVFAVFGGAATVVNLLAFANNIKYYRFDVNSSNLTVPTFLPPNITKAENMFLNASTFNQDISMWDTSNLVNMGGMFCNARAFNQNIGGWNTSKATTMSQMFNGATAFNQDISNWNVSLVAKMTWMFHEATAFNQDLSRWDVSKILTKPDAFDAYCSSWVLPKPVWGTTGAQ